MMKKLLSRLFTATLAAICLTLPAVSSAQEAIQLEVDVAAVCEDVVDLEPVGTSVSFPASVGKLSCFTRILGANEPTTITHVWYYGMDERARVDLIIKGSRWRTYSSKIIQAHEVGSWRVEVLDTEGTVLKVLQFITTSGQKAPEAQAADPVEETSTTPEAQTSEPAMETSTPDDEPAPPMLKEPDQPAE